ncbi:MAG: CmpA/NrtA family ABC transporter substrate-binding protein [Verrucomicrobiota bacterium JB025]
MAHRGLGHEETPGGNREASFLSHRHKRSQLSQIRNPIHDESRSSKTHFKKSSTYAKTYHLALYALSKSIMDDTSLPRQSQGIPIKLGFVPQCDCAPIAVASELGIFRKFGLDVSLSRELGWASVRNKIYHGDLDATQSIAGIAFALGLGFGDLRCEVSVPLILNLHGSAITLSSELSPAEIGRGEGLKDYLKHSWKKDRPFTLAAAHRFSSHHILLHDWLRKHHLDSPDDANIIFLPPPLMPKHLESGQIDGYCVGEPWNSQSILAGTGWSTATSSELSHGHPEKVLLMSGRFHRERREESILLVASLLEACRVCQDPDFRSDLISILAMEKFTGADPEVLENSLGAAFQTGSSSINGSSFHIFHGDRVNRPSIDKASWVLAGLRDIGIIPEATCGSLSRIYREDIYRAAAQQLVVA